MILARAYQKQTGSANLMHFKWNEPALTTKLDSTDTKKDAPSINKSCIDVSGIIEKIQSYKNNYSPTVQLNQSIGDN
jgi:hypothetical protein